MDYYRTDCIKSYFELVVLVNKGNKIVNEQVEALFFIIDGELFLGVDRKQKIFLCKNKERWTAGGTSYHDSLEKFICDTLNSSSYEDDNVNGLIKYHLFRLTD